MSFQSQSGQVGFKTQAAAGTYEAASVFMRTRGGSLGVNRELIIPDPEIGGTRDRTQAILGPVSYSGEYEFYARTESLATLLKGVTGSASTVATGVAPNDYYTHTITPAATLPWLSIEEAISTADTIQYTDAKVNSLSLECEPAGYLMGTAGIIAKTATAGATRTASPVWDTNPLMVGTSMTVTIGGLTSYITRSFSLELTNNIEDDVFKLGSIGLASLVEKQRELTMSMTIRPENINLWREAVFGSAAATTPQSGAAAQKAVNILIQSFENVNSSAVKYSLEIDVPYCNITPFNLEPSGDDVIEVDVEFQALKPVAATPLVTFEVVNNATAVD